MAETLSQIDHQNIKGKLVITVTVSFNTTTGQMTETSQRKQ